MTSEALLRNFEGRRQRPVRSSEVTEDKAPIHYAARRI
jgi:hypothetical protein